MTRPAHAQGAAVPLAAMSGRAMPGQVLLLVPEGYDAAKVAQIADEAGCEVVTELPYSPRYYLLKTKTRAAKPAASRSASAGDDLAAYMVTSEVRAAVDKLQANPGVLASPNYVYKKTKARRLQSPLPPVTVVPNDPLYGPSPASSAGQRWHYGLINMPQAWAIQSNRVGRTVIVGIIDGGMEENHPDLRNKMVSNPGSTTLPTSRDFSGFLFPTPRPVTDATGDVDGHGSHVGGTVAAEGNNAIGVTGVAGWNRNGVDVKMVSLKVFNREIENGDVTSSAAWIPAVNYAAQVRLDVINMSLGGGPRDASPVEQAAFDAAAATGLTVIAAAGNDGYDGRDRPPNTGYYPANYNNVINVSAVGPDRQLSAYSNFGANVAIAAPGGNATPTDPSPATQILSTYIFNAPESLVDGYAAIQGTSMAAPHVAGVAALLIAGGAPRNPTQIRNILQSTATVLDEVPNPNGGNRFGAGLLNAYAALQRIGSTGGFTIQFAEVTEAQARRAATAGNTDPGSSVTANAPYASRDRTYVNSQEPLRLRFIAGTAPETAADAARVVVEIQEAVFPNRTVQTFVGGFGEGAGLDLSTPAGTAPGATIETTVPRTGALNLPVGRYRAVLIDRGTPVGYVFFEIAEFRLNPGRYLFATPFQVDPAPTAQNEQRLFGNGVVFALSRYNPLRAEGQLDYARFANTPDAPSNDGLARFALPNPADGLPITALSSTPGTSVAPIGLGYWLDLTAPTTLAPTGSTVNNSVAIRLFASNGGWNMIGAPFTFPVSWSAVSVIYQNRSYTLADAVAANLISNVLVGYRDGQGYLYNIAPQGTLDPFNGYWVRAFVDCTLVVPPAATSGNVPAGVTFGQPTTGGPGSAPTAASRSTRLPSINGWRARLVASTAGDRDAENYFGQAAEAEGQANRLDVAKPPAGSGHAYLRFLKSDKNGRPERYAFDMRPASGGRRQEWTAAVSTDKRDADVTLTWDGIGGVPRGKELFLTDTVTGAKVSLRSRSSYRFRAGEPGETRVFKLTAEDRATTGALAITNVTLVGGGRSVQGVTLRLNTTREADVEASVLSLTGRKVADFGGRSRSAGTTGATLRWNGRSQDGGALPAGSYKIVVTARGDDGEAATVTQVYTSIK